MAPFGKSRLARKVNWRFIVYIDFVKEYFIPESILDVGACYGQFYQNCLLSFPTAYYFLVEGNSLCDEPLRNLNVDYHIGVLSDSQKTVNFYLTKTAFTCGPASTGNSVYRENTSYYNDDNVIVQEVQTTTLDLLFGSDKKFDLVKLDVQGSELDIIRGGLTLIKKAKGVLMEVAIKEYNIGAPLKEEVYAFMNSLGFSPRNVVGASYNPDTHAHIQEDVFFINKNLI